MFHFLKRLGIRFGRTKVMSRSELLRAYPNHLELIDSRKIPQTFERGPELDYFIESAEFYYELICRSAEDVVDWEQKIDVLSRDLAVVSHNRMVHGTWGLIARGGDGMFHANLLQFHSVSLVRECGENIFLGIRQSGRSQEVFARICELLGVSEHAGYQDLEITPQVLGLIGAMGWLRTRRAVPLLIPFVTQENAPQEVRQAAAVSLGRIIHKRFDRQPDIAIALALEWIAANAVAMETTG